MDGLHGVVTVTAVPHVERAHKLAFGSATILLHLAEAHIAPECPSREAIVTSNHALAVRSPLKITHRKW